MNNLTEAQAMEILHDIAHAYLDFFPLTKAGKENIKQACNLGISALKTIEDMNRVYKVTDDMKGETNND